MSEEESDPDTLQLLDELNVDWVRRWRKKVAKKSSGTGGVTFTAIIPEKKYAR